MSSRGRNSLRLRWTTLLLLLTLSSGCQLSRTFFHVDSDSHTPSIGFDLTSHDDQANLHEIRQTSAESVAPRPIEPHSAKEPAQDRTGWRRWLNPLAPQRRIPLPRTDLETDADSAEIPAGFESPAGEF